jgi:hypothetical protein
MECQFGDSIWLRRVHIWNDAIITNVIESVYMHPVYVYILGSIDTLFELPGHLDAYRRSAGMIDMK